MNHYIGRRKYKIYAFDLESHNDLESIAKKETSMWLATLIDENSKIDDENSYYYDMDSVLSKIEELSTPHRKHGESAPIKNVCLPISLSALPKGRSISCSWKVPIRRLPSTLRYFRSLFQISSSIMTKNTTEETLSRI